MASGCGLPSRLVGWRARYVGRQDQPMGEITTSRCDDGRPGGGGAAFGVSPAYAMLERQFRQLSRRFLPCMFDGVGRLSYDPRHAEWRSRRLQSTLVDTA